jgi:hypothetical protein
LCLLTPSEHVNPSPVIGGVRVARSLVLYVVFCISLFVLLAFFLSTIALSVLLNNGPRYSRNIAKVDVNTN